MKKNLKLIILFFIVFILAGCDAKWSDVQKNYQDILNSNNGNGVSCVYFATDAKDPYGIKNITFSANYNGLSAIINSKTYSLWNVNEKNTTIKFGNNSFDLNSFSTDILTYYVDNRKCPDIFFIDLMHNRFILDKTLLIDQGSPSYTRGKTTITNSKGENIDCHHTGNNITCEKYSKVKDSHVSQTYYFELGTYDNGIKYFGVSKYEDYRDMVVTEYGADGYDGFSQRYDGILFQIPANAINELWLGNNTYINKDNIKINYSFFTTTICYITGPNSVPNNGELLFEGEGVEEGPKLDPTIEEMGEEMGDPSEVELPAKGTVEGINICSQNGVKLVLHVVGYILFAAKIIVPLLLIIMGSMDFAKALMDSDDKAMKDAIAKLIKRIIAGVIIFFIPTIFNFVFSLIDDVSNNQADFTECSDCIFTPFSGGCTYTKLGE